MKSTEQLLELSTNPYYTMSVEESKRLDDFLSTNSAPKSQAPKNTDDSEKNIPATVLNKNVVKKEVGEIPTVDNVAQADSQEVAS